MISKPTNNILKCNFALRLNGIYSYEVRDKFASQLKTNYGVPSYMILVIKAVSCR